MSLRYFSLNRSWSIKTVLFPSLSLPQLFEITVPLSHGPKPVTVSFANHTSCRCMSKLDVYRQVHSIIRRSLPATQTQWVGESSFLSRYEQAYIIRWKILLEAFTIPVGELTRVRSSRMQFAKALIIVLRGESVTKVTLPFYPVDELGLGR